MCTGDSLPRSLSQVSTLSAVSGGRLLRGRAARGGGVSVLRADCRLIQRQRGGIAHLSSLCVSLDVAIWHGEPCWALAETRRRGGRRSAAGVPAPLLRLAACESLMRR